MSPHPSLRFRWLALWAGLQVVAGPPAALPAAAAATPRGAPAAQAAAPRRATLADEAALVAQSAGRLAEDEANRRLAQAFRVSVQQVTELRDQKLALGDVAAALAVAKVAGKTVDAALTLWANQRLNWDDVAAHLGAPRRQVLRLLRSARQALSAAPAR